MAAPRPWTPKAPSPGRRPHSRTASSPWAGGNVRKAEVIGRERTGGDRNVEADIPEFSGTRDLNVQTAREQLLVHFSSSLISDWWKMIASLARTICQ
jgi:hypothetical protein